MKRSPLWLLFTILFLASFDMHAQMPLLSPYLHMLGAPAAMIGVVMGAYSVSHITGNLVAGTFLDRYAKKTFITVGLLLAGIMLVGQGYAQEPTAFFCLRLVMGFLMAFVSPACYALLAGAGRSLEEQGEIMAKKGMVTTAAAIISPSVGGFMAGGLGYDKAFVIFGIIMLLAGLIAVLFLPNEQKAAASSYEKAAAKKKISTRTIRQMIAENPSLYLAFAGGFSVLYGQGTLVYQIPLMVQQQGLSPTVTGNLFSMMGIGSFVVLSQLWLKHISPQARISFGLSVLGLLFYVLAIGLPVSYYLTLSLVGGAMGVLFPAMTTLLAQCAPKETYGAVFSLYSAILSIGTIISPLLAGFIANAHHAFFIAFFVIVGTGLFTIVQNGLPRQVRS